jgi:hypothetical protein
METEFSLFLISQGYQCRKVLKSKNEEKGTFIFHKKEDFSERCVRQLGQLVFNPERILFYESVIIHVLKKKIDFFHFNLE